MSDESPVQSLLASHADETNRESTDGNDGKQHGCYSEHPRDLRMLDLRLVHGSCRAKPYHYLEDIEINGARSHLKITFPDCRVLVEGQRLWRVYQALTSHRVGYLSVSTSSPAVSLRPERMSDGSPNITSIELISEAE